MQPLQAAAILGPMGSRERAADDNVSNRDERFNENSVKGSKKGAEKRKSIRQENKTNGVGS